MKKWVSVVLLMFLFAAGCSEQGKGEEVFPTSLTMTGTQTPSPTPTSMIVPTSTPTSGPTVTATPSPTMTATPSPTSTPTPTPVPDVEPPILMLFAGTTIEVIAQSEFEEPGFVAVDKADGELTKYVKTSGEVDVNWCGTYVLSYEVTDKSGNYSKAERTVIVRQPEEIIPEEKVLYLTFDDGPGKYTNDILAILEKYHIKATFFTCGNGQPKQVTKIHEAGHTVAIHCKNHDYDVVYASEEAYFEDLFAMQDLVYECTGVKTTMLRFPGGSSNEVSKFNPGIMTRLTDLVEQRGFQYFDWHVSSSDTKLKDPQEIFENVKSKVGKRKYAVILMHSEVKKYSMEAVEDIIIWGLENGYTFLPLDPSSPKAHHSVHN